MRTLTLVTTTLLLMTVGAFAADLYRVAVDNPAQANLLNENEVDALVKVRGGYLVLTDQKTADALEPFGISFTKIAENVQKSELALDIRPDVANLKNYPLLFQEENLRLLKTGHAARALSVDGLPLISLADVSLPIAYKPQFELNETALGMLAQVIDLNALIAKVSQDSLVSYTEHLQAFDGRVAGTQSNHDASQWLFDQFQSFGYDSVYFDNFTASIGGSVKSLRNVVATKLGTRYPNRHVIVGAHFDAVPGSPGADDNGSGTAATLEIARALSDVETDMSIVFIPFDGEEYGLFGSKNYADSAYARGDSIVAMFNMDMIAYEENSDMAKLFYGDVIAYAQLWAKLADSLSGINITGVLSGSAGNSDHASFIQRGYDAVFSHEFIFNTPHYHTTSDSTVYLNYDYMKRMVQATLASAYTVNASPPPVTITAVRDVGDGHSLQVEWNPLDPSQIDYYRLYYSKSNPIGPLDSVVSIPNTESQWVIDTLIEGQQYTFFMVAFDNDGRSSVAVQTVKGTPYSVPRPPQGLTALPIKNGVHLTWDKNNTELDLDRYDILRDGVFLNSTLDTTYDDMTASGSQFYDYRVVAVDTDENSSDTAGTSPVSMRGATLEIGHILAINRSSPLGSAYIEPDTTKELMMQALAGYSFDYFDDTQAKISTKSDTLHLIDMLDYEILVIGAESARMDDLGGPTFEGGILDTLSYYLSIGGKVVVFGRWGDLTVQDSGRIDTLYYSPNSPDISYTRDFNIFARHKIFSYLRQIDGVVTSDLIGAHSQETGYPELEWDSLATQAQVGLGGVTGIMSPSFSEIIPASDVSIIYTYNSSTGDPLTNDKPVGWRKDHSYVFFEIPLSFVKREQAIAALQKAIADLGTQTDADDDNGLAGLPTTYTLGQNFPNPFNPTTTIEFYSPTSTGTATLDIFNILGQHIRRLFDGRPAAGVNRIEWDGTTDNGKATATGIYFYRLKTGDAVLSRKMLLIK